MGFQRMTKTAEINSRLLEDLPVVRLPKFVPPGDGLSIWWMGDDRITFQATSADTNGAYAFWVDEPPGNVGPPKHVHSREEEGFYVIEGQVEFRAGHINGSLVIDDSADTTARTATLSADLLTGLAPARIEWQA